jgi:hypothetical protein
VVEIVDSPPNPSAFNMIGTWFPIGFSEQAASGWVYSIDQFISMAGARDPACPIYDSVQEFFREGGYRAKVNTAVKGGTDIELVALLDGILNEDGPGAVSAPGVTTVSLQVSVAQFVDDTARIGILDAPNDPVPANLVTAANAVTGQPGDWRCGMFAPWDIIPGIVSGTTRTVPPCGRIAGNLARNDGQGYGADDPAAGALGVAQYANDLSQPAWNDGDRTVLNGAGVNVTRLIYGVPRTYGFRSLADQLLKTDWSEFGSSRTIMSVEWALSIVAENFVFSKLDGLGFTLNRWKAALTGALNPFYLNGDLYGTTPQEAYSVGIGPDVNTAQTFANGQLFAKVGLRTSSMAEQVYVMIAKIPITESLAA